MIRGSATRYGETWMPLRDVMYALGVTRTRVHQLVKEGKLSYMPPEKDDRHWKGQFATGYFAMREVRALAWERTARLAPTPPPLTEAELEDRGAWRTVQEAAKFLDMSLSGVHGLIRSGKVAACRVLIKGGNGFYYLVRRSDAERYRWCKAHLLGHKKRDGMRKKQLCRPRAASSAKAVKPICVAEEGQEDTGRDSPPALEPEEEPDWEWLSSADIMRWLGVGHTAVVKWRKAGRLPAVPHGKRRRNGPKWWHRKEDVLALLADPAFAKQRAQWLKTSSKEAAGRRQVARVSAFLDGVEKAQGFQWR